MTEVGFVEELKKQWMAMIDAIDDPLVILDPDFKIIRQNLAYSKIAAAPNGRSIRDFPGQACYEVFAGRKTKCTHCKLAKGAVTQAISWQTSELVADKHFDIHVHPVQGQDKFYVVHYRDITSQVKLQETLARADKLAALGQLVGGVAHEINSPLAGILAFSQMALKEMDEGDAHRDDMREIEEAAQKCKVIVEGMLGFARQDKPTDLGDLCLFDTMRSTLRLASPLLKKHHIDLELNFEPEHAWVRGNNGKLSQVFLNLVTNAIYAMREGGSLSICGTHENNRACLVIQDSGTGIDAKVLGKIFDPFFTTKPIGEGTGLGLSIAYSIIKQHQGTIDVKSEIGLGTTFSVSIPLGESHQ